jgi:hypothetical protein
MAFTARFMAHAHDADNTKHRSVIDTGSCRLYTVVVKDQEEAVEVCSRMVHENRIEFVLLCPGFSHADIAQIAKTAGPKVSVSVLRGDGPINRVALEAGRREGLT